MQIAIFSPGFPPYSIGGEEYYAYYQAKELAQNGMSVYVMANAEKKNHSKQASKGVNLYLVKSTNTKNDLFRYAVVSLKFAFSFLRLKVRPNIIHAHDPYGEGLAAVLVGKILNVPIVITWHAAELIESKAHFSYIGNINRRLVLQEANRIIVNSPFFRNLALNLVGDSSLRSKTRVISPGVDLEEFNAKNATENIRKKLADNDQLVVLSVCRLEKIKGLDLLIRSIPQVVLSIPNVKFVIVGTGSQLEELRELARDLKVADYISFLGNIPRSLLPSYYSACDLFIVPTRGEGFGMAYIEAWSCSKPIIVTPFAPEIAKLVQKFGGGLVAEDNCLSDAIIKILSSNALRSIMGNTGRQIVESNYSWKETGCKNIEVYQELISK